jgi:hypothetical protein
MNCCNDYGKCVHGHGCPIPTLTEVHAHRRAQQPTQTNQPAKENTVDKTEQCANKAAWNRKMMIEMAQEPYQTSHIIHFILSLLTGGLWVIVWVIVALRNANRRRQVARRFGWAE